MGPGESHKSESFAFTLLLCLRFLGQHSDFLSLPEPLMWVS